ncbi:hypothetical protein SETIT_2G366000v2 [Setaria italica]|uniref:Reverse transcriptase zinc-binding domain-containing protein n=2 Tax=Setaria italica TaxID=4555 RepID=A0A368Q8V7_SETIT|nr:hypothetical protein SETIT_2G366000v2 [Setaria italica]
MVYLQIWDIVENVVLQQDTPDQYKWKLSQSGSYSTPETIHHLLVGCVFSRQVWVLIFQHLGLIHLAPESPETRFFGWWRKTFLAVPKDMRKGLNSLIILVAWEIWKHGNDCVFEKVRPKTQEVLRAISNEGGLWCMAGASKLQELVSRSPPLGV